MARDLKTLPPEEIVAGIIRVLYDAGANEWTIQEKGVLVAAVKQQLAERKDDASEGE